MRSVPSVCSPPSAPSSLPTESIGVRITDTGGTWVIDGRDGTVAMAAAGVEPQAELSGAAVDVLLQLWGRPVTEGAVKAAGDETVADEWLALGGV